MIPRETLDRYADAFGEWPPLVVWRGTDEDLANLCEEAMRAARKLTEADLLKAQGKQPAPEGSLY